MPELFFNGRDKAEVIFHEFLYNHFDQGHPYLFLGGRLRFYTQPNCSSRVSSDTKYMATYSQQDGGYSFNDFST